MMASCASGRVMVHLCGPFRALEVCSVSRPGLCCRELVASCPQFNSFLPARSQKTSSLQAIAQARLQLAALSELAAVQGC